jgi:DNA-directed RNA polymerase subunit RPC12/RpoP
MLNSPPPGFVRTESQLDGITLFKPASKAEKLDATVNFRCPNCDGETAFSAADGGLTCTYCGYHEAPEKETVGKSAEQFEFTVTTVQQASHGWGVERKELECQTCASQISLPAGALTITCPFCGSNKVVHHKAAQDVLRPRFLIPFAVDDHRCHSIAREWLGSSWLVPKELRRVAAVDDFTAMYLPFWTFDSTSTAAWKAQVGHTRTRRDSKGRTRTETVWRWESGQARVNFDDMVVRGTDRVSLHLLDQIKKYDLSALAPYEASFLAGQHAQAYEIGLEDAWEKARHVMRDRTKEVCRKQATTNKIRNFSMQLDFSDESWRYILLPVYINTYHFDEKPYQLLINGQTGAIAGQRPADWRKIALVAAALMLPGLLIFLILMLFVQDVYGSGGGFLSFLLFAAGVAASIYMVWQAQKLDEV